MFTVTLMRPLKSREKSREKIKALIKENPNVTTMEMSEIIGISIKGIEKHIANLKKEGIKYVFYQDIFRLPDMKVTVKATVESVCVVNGRLGDSALFDETFAPYLSE